MREFTPNSHKYREEQKNVSEDSGKKIEKVVTGSTKSRKRSGARKLRDILIPEDMNSIKSHIVFDVIIPAGKKVLSDALDAVLYPDGSGKRKRNADRVSYRDYYDRDDRRREYRMPGRGQSEVDYDDIVFDNRGDAEVVLNAMDETIDRYGFVSIADLYDLADISTTNYTLAKYGWTSLRNAKIIRLRSGEGFVIDFPRALPWK